MSLRPLVDVAIQGVGGSVHPRTGTPCDALVDRLEGLDDARRLLLLAGACAVAQRAATRPLTGIDAPRPAPMETRRVCRPAVGELVTRLCSGPFRELLPELGARLDRAGQRLPAELLPYVLALEDERARTALRDALGARGRWLAEQWAAPEAWKWILRESSQETGALTFKNEAAAEARLDDDHLHVRAQAAEWLAGRPDSGLLARLRERANHMLFYQPRELEVTLPETLDPPWRRDLAQTRPPAAWSSTPQAFWFLQTLAQVPPSHWQRRFEATPEELIAAAREHPQGPLVLEGWSRAAARHEDSTWADLLFDVVAGRLPRLLPQFLPRLLPRLLLPAMTPPRREERLVEMLRAAPRSELRRLDLLGALPGPWSDRLARAFLAAARNEAWALSRGRESEEDPLWTGLIVHARDLPESVFDEAARGWPELDGDDWWRAQCKRQIDAFRDLLEVRTILWREIPLTEME